MVDDFTQFARLLRLDWNPNPRTGAAAVFLWGARQTGKTTYLRATLPQARFYDLLDTALAAELAVRPHLLREEVLATTPEVVVIDDVQHAPQLLAEVHWLLENSRTRFVLCGSSARKLRRNARNLLGGRAIEQHMLPLTSAEIGDVDLLRMLRHGGLPVHYLVDDPAAFLRAYVNSYLKAEIIDESATRNVPAFSRFLHVVGLSCGAQINHAAVARETGVAANTVRSYFQILEDTLLGFTLEPWRRRHKRRLVDTAKFYLVDLGVASHLHPDGPVISEGSERFGHAFEHFVINEVRAYLAYRRPGTPLSFWRTSTGFEVDLIVGDLELAIEIKSGREVRRQDLKGLRALHEEQHPRRSLIVAREPVRRRTEDGIEIWPWRAFCEELWAGGLI